MQKGKNVSSSSNYKAKKQYGQNFLTDHNILTKIVDGARINENTTVIEIGPGLGALTKELLKRSKKVIAFEVDSDLISYLKENTKEYTNLEIVNEDILKTDINKILNAGEDLVSVSNLPYYITSPIIDLFLFKMTNVHKAVFMVQKEVADRISASVNTKDYNSFSILVQYYAKVKKLFNVPRTAFNPAPNVDSAVIEIEKFERNFKPKDETLYKFVVESAFKERRKTLVNNLSSSFYYSKGDIKEMLIKLEIDENVRGEALSIDDFINLTNEIEKKMLCKE